MINRFAYSPIIYFTLALWVFAVQNQAFAGEIPAAGADPESPVTTANPDIPVTELAILLRPLSKAELLREADGWQSLVQDIARQIARAEIAVQRENLEIEKEDKLTGKVRQAQQKLDDLIATADEARAKEDLGAVTEVQQAITEIQETLQEIETVVDEYAEAHRQKEAVASEISEDAGETIAPDVQNGDKVSAESADVDLGEAIHAVTSDTLKSLNKIKGTESTRAASGTNTQEESAGAVTIDPALLNSMGESIKILEEVEESTKAEKVRLLERIGKLRDQRTQRLDNLRAVIEELRAKTDTKDADTEAKITDYQLFVTRVSGIDVDVTDTTSTWVTIRGWTFSDQGGKRWALNALHFAGIVLVTLLFSRLFSKLVIKVGTKLGFPALLKNVLASSVRWVVIGIGTIWALSALEFSIAPLLAVVGAAGFVIAFAMQDSLSNFAAGLMILMFRPFDLGDTVEAGGVSGKISSMNLVSTTIKTFDNKLMIVPNSKIWNEVITNATGVTRRRVDMVFGIGYDDDIDKAQAVLEEIVAKHPRVLKTPEPTIRVSELADSSVNFICRPWVLPDDYWEVYWDLTEEVKKRFDAASIGIPFPQRDVHLHIVDGENLPGSPVAPRGEEKDS